MPQQESESSRNSRGEEPEPRQRILAAASQLMAQKGIKGATTRQISQLAGVNEVTIFRHFSNKKGIVVELMTEMLDLREPLEQSLQGDISQIREMLIRYGKTYYNLMVERKELMMICVMEADNVPEIRKLFSNLPLSVIQLLDAKLKSFQEEGHLLPEVCTWGAAAMFTSLFFQAFMARYRMQLELPVSEEELFEHPADILLRGILAPKEIDHTHS